jgi:hypothetical protein
MLIKLTGHFIDNPQHIDKVIAIKGLPEEWMFRPSKYGGKELIRPWVPDVAENIPLSIRHLCEETEVTVVFPPIEKGRDSVVDKIKIIGLKLDFGTEPGQDLWMKIERYVEQMTPRDQKVPKPVLCAPNHKSDFSPHEVRKTIRGSLELRPTEVPMVDLRQSLVGPRVEVAPPVVIPKPVVEQKEEKVTVSVEDNKKTEELKIWQCKKCDQKFTELGKLRGHNLRGHKEIREKIEV